MWTKRWWRDTVERVIRGVASNLISTLSVDGLDLANLDWTTKLAAAGIQGVITFLVCIVGSETGQRSDTASLVE